MAPEEREDEHRGDAAVERNGGELPCDGNQADGSVGGSGGVSGGQSSLTATGNEKPPRRRGAGKKV